MGLTVAKDEPIIEVRGLRNVFGEQVVHEDLDLDVRRGEILGVVGGSGTGKSVLMRSIIGLQTPAAGEIKVFGEDMVGRDDPRAFLGEAVAGGSADPARTTGHQGDAAFQSAHGVLLGHWSWPEPGVDER